MECYTMILSINQDTHLYPIVVSIGHSGTYIPSDIQQKMDASAAYLHTDWYVDTLYAFLIDKGISVLFNAVSRYVIDVNRSLHPSTQRHRSLIPLVDSKGKALYTRPPGKHVQETYIRQFYQPYHQQLTQMIEAKKRYFDTIYLIDLHSFTQPFPVDVILGNQKNRTCSKKWIDHVEQSFQSNHFSTVQNHHFSGGFITSHYGKRKDVEAIQIEIAQHLYLASNGISTALHPPVQTRFQHQWMDLLSLWNTPCK